MTVKGFRFKGCGVGSGFRVSTSISMVDLGNVPPCAHMGFKWARLAHPHPVERHAPHMGYFQDRERVSEREGAYAAVVPGFGKKGLQVSAFRDPNPRVPQALHLLKRRVHVRPCAIASAQNLSYQHHS